MLHFLTKHLTDASQASDTRARTRPNQSEISCPRAVVCVCVARAHIVFVDVLLYVCVLCIYLCYRYGIICILCGSTINICRNR